MSRGPSRAAQTERAGRSNIEEKVRRIRRICEFDELFCGTHLLLPGRRIPAGHAEDLPTIKPGFLHRFRILQPTAFFAAFLYLLVDTIPSAYPDAVLPAGVGADGDLHPPAALLPGGEDIAGNRLAAGAAQDHGAAVGV